MYGITFRLIDTLLPLSSCDQFHLLDFGLELFGLEPEAAAFPLAVLGRPEEDVKDPSP